MPPFLQKRSKTKELAQNGLYVGTVHNEDGLKRFAICMLRGLMVFLACYGTVVGTVEAFDIPYNATVVTLFLLFISLFASFLYIRKIVFYIGYFLLLFGFTYELARYYPYANSGFQAITNIVYEEYSDYFKLLSLREAQELITNRYLTVTVVMILIGAFLAILLNVTISGYMNLLETILITFPFLEIAFYIEKRPPLYCVMMLVAAYICVGIQQASRHFKMQVKGKHTPEYMRFRRKKTTTYTYQSSAKGTLQTLLFSLAFATIIGLGFYNSYYSEVPEQPTNEIKKTTDEYVKTFVQSGFTGLFDRYDSTGGLNHGRLGGVSSIRPDFETDLTVTFAPYSYNTVYLKSFTGSHYSNNLWTEHSYLNTFPEAIEVVPADVAASYQTTSSNNLIYMDRETIASYDAQYAPATASSGKMEIVCIDTGDDVFLPYFSSDADCVISDNADSQAVQTVYYTPYLGKYDEKTDAFVLPEYYDVYVNQFCLQVPDEIRSSLEDYCVEQEFPGIVSGEFNDAPADPENINAYRLAVARAIYSHYVEDFDYTMSPGTTPYRQDFVEYFLTTQKRGVCAHFAASATMLLRTMGIPARYVEGYCIPLSTMSNGQGIDANYDEWYQGPTQVAEKGVLTVDVTDAQAHAWVEIYLEGYGFVPFEMTPPDFMEDNPTNFDFGGIFDNLFSTPLPMNNIIGEDYNAEDYEREELSLLSFSFKTSATPFIIMIASVAGIIGLLFLGRYLWKLYKNHRLLKEEKYSDLIYQDYEDLCRKVKAKKAFDNPNPLPDELCQHIKDILAPLDITADQKEEMEELFRLLEKSLYAPAKMTAEEYQKFKTILKQVYQLLKTKPAKNQTTN